MLLDFLRRLSLGGDFKMFWVNFNVCYVISILKENQDK